MRPSHRFDGLYFLPPCRIRNAKSTRAWRCCSFQSRGTSASRLGPWKRTSALSAEAERTKTPRRGISHWRVLFIANSQSKQLMCPVPCVNFHLCFIAGVFRTAKQRFPWQQHRSWESCTWARPCTPRPNLGAFCRFGMSTTTRRGQNTVWGFWCW